MLQELTLREIFERCYRSYLIARGADPVLVEKTPVTYLRELYANLLTYGSVVAPAYAYLTRIPGQTPSKLKRARLKKFNDESQRLERHQDPETRTSTSWYYRTEYFNATHEKPVVRGELTLREQEVLSRTSDTFAQMIVPKFSREHALVPSGLFEVYLGVIDSMRGGTLLPDIDSPVDVRRAAWLEDLFDLFNQCYR